MYIAANESQVVEESNNGNNRLALKKDVNSNERVKNSYFIDNGRVHIIESVINDKAPE